MRSWVLVLLAIITTIFSHTHQALLLFECRTAVPTAHENEIRPPRIAGRRSIAQSSIKLPHNSGCLGRFEPSVFSFSNRCPREICTSLVELYRKHYEPCKRLSFKTKQSLNPLEHSPSSEPIVQLLDDHAAYSADSVVISL